MRVLIEVVHIALGLASAVLIASLASWAYRQATDDIWLVAFVGMGAVIVMGIGPLRRAYAIDKAKLGRGARADG
jgi:hypothetical protein